MRPEPTFDEAEESALPLLPLSNTHPGHEGKKSEASGSDADELPQRYGRAHGVAGWWRCAAASSAVLGLVAGTVILTLSLVPLLADPTNPIINSTAARDAIDELYARQSTTLEQATARYALRTGRAPPLHYARWFQFAREKKCLLDEYDQIHRDFKVFYQLTDSDPSYFQAMIDRAAREVRRVYLTLHRPTAYSAYWPETLRHFSWLLPNMTFFMNGRDEPRVAFNYRDPGAREAALAPSDSTPFLIEPHPTAEFFASRSGCVVPLEAAGLMASANEDNSFLLSSAKPGFTTDLYPVLSMAKISPCFSDILFPTEYYYDRSWWSGHYAHPDNVPWDQKKSQIYWRGMFNGGLIDGTNYRHFARFKLIDIGRAHPDLMDVAITKFAETLCGKECDRAAVVAEYAITGDGQPREDLYGYKYALDVDGTTFSGRFLGLLRSGSLVFKSTLFEEYFNDWLRPYEHYVPVLADLSDLVEKIEWANAHPEEARLIQQRGLEMARRVLTDDQNDCYFFAVLLEWARLQGCYIIGGSYIYPAIEGDKR
ncbi:glycosyl transferase family 90-domain-containing protein [Mycena vulgaris]|nr:glycosyl transferase family 90-domain-containing protein [Mycena vulgaris]